MHSDRETGFLPSLGAVTKSYRKNPVSGHFRDRDLRTPTEKPGFYRVLALSRSLIEKTRFLATFAIETYASKPKKPGFYARLCTITKSYRKNPVSGQLCDRDLRIKTKETGFFAKSAGYNEVFKGKTRFLTPGSVPLTCKVLPDCSNSLPYKAGEFKLIIV
ncbi:hypothetical protein CP500_005175 [Tychonema bourrellyi FEM_GT703]|uniref:Uncharacterized protein n=1 Tax=Tychonema bourrellyi FEM_GT703 TaxID=2040638 RepID=A0A2G4F3Z5_9CYAN|nr:hypothetical protein [Tychonema bourrellyi]PHX56482.1 hypothetical protein CP500_005175 [Tychonema bourrellyi FEM_GT703]